MHASDTFIHVFCESNHYFYTHFDVSEKPKSSAVKSDGRFKAKAAKL